MALQSQVSPPRQAKDISRRTRSGRIEKNATQRQSRSTRTRQSMPTRAEALPPDRRRGLSKPDVLEELGDNTPTAPQRRRRRRKTYKKERASRRLAGQPPEFRVLPGQGEKPPLYEASLRRRSNSGKTSSSGPRGGKLPKKLTAGNGAKPQGISKSKQNGATRPRRPMSSSKLCHA